MSLRESSTLSPAVEPSPEPRSELFFPFVHDFCSYDCAITLTSHVVCALRRRKQQRRLLCLPLSSILNPSDPGSTSASAPTSPSASAPTSPSASDTGPSSSASDPGSSAPPPPPSSAPSSAPPSSASVLTTPSVTVGQSTVVCVFYLSLLFLFIPWRSTLYCLGGVRTPAPHASDAHALHPGPRPGPCSPHPRGRALTTRRIAVRGVWSARRAQHIPALVRIGHIPLRGPGAFVSPVRWSAR
ncbi:hypothetical protein B0H17DRAFT_602437 [Mycena rosella]|uniref:Uncharacterized protein n=1 Tax=Mycena rosella TaxID=1033263 RepID=A0AAD7DF63_MYCRO|nr:hypothetical protein B0H17DRAFT_602437 [Mycena rosella]